MFHDCEGEMAHHLENEHQNEKDSHDHGDEDQGCLPCSPFHSCQTQVKINTSTGPEYAFGLIEELEFLIPAYYTPRFSAPRQDIWQPPKI
jgi:hypothetical protein